MHRIVAPKTQYIQMQIVVGGLKTRTWESHLKPLHKSKKSSNERWFHKKRCGAIAFNAFTDVGFPLQLIPFQGL